ncbi:glycosyltransferase [Stutzerimonas kirkiae]|uniref:Glycosyltransferase n=1 Tax=Stutzerimonas kirkiae TaxID=2211392 RepID=A0A4V2KCN8_9GAMM|nr:glycosyltransferase [Stutzerimonas kirkiae]TBU95742.1 glycosyltransferase [Stutzerimonas kirkiae]TBV02733.1 glycosyltransferase [Stutzerimonas kirkiae]TBV12264.1 glycosyltransferase [Stutzerimonas kirkiae]TBV13246.1 glycosyltransferase [Stutzerimonas kirkiae]
MAESGGSITKYKVLQIQNRYNVSASDLAEQIIQGLPEERFEVTTAFLRGAPGEGEPRSRASRSVYFGFSKAATKGLRLRVLWVLYRHCRRERYDAVIAHRFKPINAFMLLNFLLRIPACIGVLHGLGEYDRRYRRWELHWLLKGCWRFVGVSRAVYEDLSSEQGANLPAEHVRRINNAIDIDHAESLQHPGNEARRRLGLPDDVFVFGTIGRLVPVKGHVHLLQAFASVAPQAPQAHLAIIGEGRGRDELEALIDLHGLHGRVHLLGAKDDALQYVRAFDAFVMPSLSEGLPLALLEGMSGHLPVVGSDIDSLRPILQDCGGRVFAVGKPEELAKQLSALLALSPAERRCEGDTAYAYLRRAHGIEDFRRQYRELVEELVVRH